MKHRTSKMQIFLFFCAFYSEFQEKKNLIHWDIVFAARVFQQKLINFPLRNKCFKKKL